MSLVFLSTCAILRTKRPCEEHIRLSFGIFQKATVKIENRKQSKHQSYHKVTPQEGFCQTSVERLHPSLEVLTTMILNDLICQQEKIYVFYFFTQPSHLVCLLVAFFYLLVTSGYFWLLLVTFLHLLVTGFSMDEFLMFDFSLVKTAHASKTKSC